MPIILLVVALGLFVFYTNSTYQGTKSLQAQVNAYDDALTKSKELKKVLSEKNSAFSTFTAENKQRLVRILPDNVDNIHLIIDIQSIAARHNLSIKNVQLGTISDSASARSAFAVGVSGDAVGSIRLGFTVASSYDDFLAFLQDMEHSLRVVDVEKITFNTSEKDLNDYSLSIRTYWLH